MKKYLLLLLLFAVAGSSYNCSVKAQSVELLAGNTLNGAMNGVLLGGATMALQNNDDFEPLRIGLGAGTLYGIGVGVYDLTKVNKGQQFYISGTFNDGTNSSILVLLDTFYGAAGGALIASSVSLIIQEPLVDALQYGSGAGAWVGFGFGLVDAFVLSEGPNYSEPVASFSGKGVNGLLTYSNASNSVQLGMISPEIFRQTQVSKSTLTTTYSSSVNVVNLKLKL